jgi:hypothetical protein
MVERMRFSLEMSSSISIEPMRFFSIESRGRAVRLTESFSSPTDQFGFHGQFAGLGFGDALEFLLHPGIAAGEELRGRLVQDLRRRGLEDAQAGGIAGGDLLRSSRVITAFDIDSSIASL